MTNENIEKKVFVREYSTHSRVAMFNFSLVLQKGINLSFPSFKFAGSEDGKFEMELHCSVREFYS